MACFATPYGLRYAAHCFNRADAQNNRPALIPAGGKLGVTSAWVEKEILPGIEGGALEGADIIVVVAALRAWEDGGAWDIAHARG